LEKRQNDSLLIRENNFDKNGQCLFVQRWCEMFYPKTINTYQYKLRNTHYLLKEMLRVINDVKQHKVSGSNLVDLCQECKRLVINDICLREFKPMLIDTLSKGVNFKNAEKSSILNLEYRVKYSYQIISQFYLDKLLESLFNAIQQDNFKVIIHLTESLGTELINYQWSPRSLARLVKIIFISEKYVKKSFYDKWYIFANNIKSDKGLYYCVFRLEPTYISKIKMIRNAGIKVCSGKDILENHKSMIHGEENLNREALYILEESESYLQDSNTAVEKCLKKIALKQSVLSFYGIELNSFRNAFIIFPNDEKIIPYNIEEDRINIKYVTDQDKSIMESLKVINSEYIDNESKQRIMNFFRQYSLSSESISPETKFSNLWSALESLLIVDQHDSHIDQIKKSIASILCNRYIKWLLTNFIEDCGRVGIRLVYNEREIKTDHPTIDDQKNVLQLLCDDKGIEEFLKENTNHTLLSQRAKTLSNCLEDSSSLTLLLKNHYDNLVWHIQRMYRVRNNFVHAAKREQDINILSDHLNFYLKSVMSEIIYKINYKNLRSLGSLFISAEDEYISKIAVLEKSGKKSKYDIDLIFDDLFNDSDLIE
jgi:hypothetical protein